MKVNLPMKIILVMALTSLFGLLAIGCEPYQVITFENRTTAPVKFIISAFPRDYTGNLTRTWNDPGDTLGAGESKKFVTDVPNTKVTYEKFVVIAVSEKDVVVFSRIFTWDELHEANWKVVIQ